MRLRFTTTGLCIALTVLLAAAHAESGDSPDTTLHVNVQEVRVLITATDARARHIATLSPSDFDLFDNGLAVRNLSSFAICGARHLRLTVLVDDSDSLRSRDELEHAVLGAFHDATGDDDVTVLPFSSRFDNNTRTPRTAMYDAIVAAAKWITADPEHPAPAIVLVTDGEDTASMSTIHDALAAALERGIPIYALYVGDTRYVTRGQQALEFLAGRSGGRVLYPRNRHDITATAIALRDSLRQSYVASYHVPSATDQPGSFHTIRLVAHDSKRLRLQARTGYFQSQ